MSAPEKVYPLDISEFARLGAPKMLPRAHVDAIAAKALAEDERNALEWLDEIAPNAKCKSDPLGQRGERHARMLKAMIMPDEPTPELLESLMDAHTRAMIERGQGYWDTFYRVFRAALHAHLSKLETKTAWDVTVAGVGPMERCKREEQVLDVIREFGAKHEITIVPVEVPAD